MKKLQRLFFRRSVLGALLLGMSTLLSLPAYSQGAIVDVQHGKILKSNDF